ncbi:MAG: hypothetical protein HC771_12260 [Synechococcales cyanobacterium CRU_2_2]|nr:hypothetical protein [Synechococcales cyanobacterium CRU_2_2]
MSTTLATFKIDAEKWSAFKEKAGQKSNASAVLKLLVDRYLAGEIEADGGGQSIAVGELSDRLLEIESRLGKLSAG